MSAIRDAVATPGDPAVIHETTSMAELDAAVAFIHERGTDCVVLAGGDGSYLAGTTALSRVFGDAMPAIAFAPGGTVSTVARNWGFTGSAPDYARRLIRAVLDRGGVRTKRPTLHVKDDRGGDRIGFIFGAGLVAHFFDAYYDAPIQGYATAAAIVARVFVGSFTGGALARRILSPTRCKLIVDGETQSPQSFTLIAASVVRDLGLHMHLLHRAAEDPAAFHLVASALPAAELGPQMPRVLRGLPLEGAGHVDRLAKEMLLELGDESGAYVLDGDRIRAGAVTITPGPVLDFVAAPPR